MIRMWIGMTSVVACRVGLPDVYENVREGLASLHIDNSNIKQQQQPVLILRNILSDRMPSLMVIRTFSDLRRKDARIILNPCC